MSKKLFPRFSIQVFLEYRSSNIFLKDQIINILGLQATVPQPLNFAVVGQKKLLTVHEQLVWLCPPIIFLNKNMQLPLPAPVFKRLIVLDNVFRFMIHVELTLGYALK